MANFNPDGSVQTNDGRTVYADDPVTVGDLAELSKLLGPKGGGGGGWPFVSGGGGGGGGGGSPLTPVGNGAQGSQGSTGSQGSQGSQGVQGPGAGAQGAQGSQGTQGAQGSAGVQGSQGQTGSGAQGAQGSQGSGGTGPQGAQGTTGAQGATGTGTQGAQGSTGSQGSTGAQGSQGSSGAQGGIWTLIQSQTILVDTDTVDFLGLDGEFDGYYYLDATTIKGAAGTVNVNIQPNADAANGLSQLLIFGTSLAPTQSGTAAMQFYSSGGSTGDAQRAFVSLYPKTGLPRQGIADFMESSIGFNSVYRAMAAISYMESVTPITSLRLKASVAGGIKAGSVYTLYKVSPA